MSFLVKFKLYPEKQFFQCENLETNYSWLRAADWIEIFLSHHLMKKYKDDNFVSESR